MAFVALCTTTRETTTATTMNGWMLELSSKVQCRYFLGGNYVEQAAAAEGSPILNDIIYIYLPIAESEKST